MSNNRGCSATRQTEFQIPMRGNEMDSGSPRATARSFQIPMRGNEPDGAQNPAPASAAFQIPMRGNEVSIGSHYIEVGGGFKSP